MFILLQFLSSFLLIFLFVTAFGFDSHTDRHLQKIGFGSCSKVGYGLSYWDTITSKSPDAWFWMGDNVYGKTKGGTSLKNVEQNYYILKQSEPYQKFLQSPQKPIVEGTYDDHDMGTNDGSKHVLPHIQQDAQKLLLNFLDIPLFDPNYDETSDPNNNNNNNQNINKNNYLKVMKRYNKERKKRNKQLKMQNNNNNDNEEIDKENEESDSTQINRNPFHLHPRRIRHGTYSAHLYGDYNLHNDQNNQNNPKNSENGAKTTQNRDLPNILTIFLDTRTHRDHTPIPSIAWMDQIPGISFIASYFRWIGHCFGWTRALPPHMMNNINNNNNNNIDEFENSEERAERRRKMRLIHSKLFKGMFNKQTFNSENERDVLGATQWNWLENDILSNDTVISQTDLIIIVSSIQVFTHNAYFESWGHFPYAKKRLLQLINDKLLSSSDGRGGFNGNVVFLSGDVHHSEFLSGNKEYGPLEVTSSGLTHTMGSLGAKSKITRYLTEQYGKYQRLSKEFVFYDKNFGMLTVLPSDESGDSGDSGDSNEDRGFEYKIEIFDVTDGSVGMEYKLGTGSKRKDKDLLKNIIYNELNDENRLFMTKVYVWYGFELLIPFVIIIGAIGLCLRQFWKDSVFYRNASSLYEKQRLNKQV